MAFVIYYNNNEIQENLQENSQKKKAKKYIYNQSKIYVCCTFIALYFLDIETTLKANYSP